MVSKLFDKLMEGNPIALIVMGLIPILLAIYWDWFIPLLTLLITGTSWERPLPIGLKILLAVIGVIAVGAGVGQLIFGKRERTRPDAEEREPARESPLRQRIDFDYQDSPENHGWQVEGSPSFSLQSGGVLDIPPNQRYSMNYDVKPFACAGTLIEFVARYEADNAAVYARVTIQRQDSAEHKGAWIKFKIGSHLSEPSQDGSQEWVWYTQPTMLEDRGWAKFEVDLPHVVEQTFGEDWTYRELKKFRLRGGLKIKYIAVYS
ncbi:MAG: hypothetical protein P8Z40_05035 [Chloroflexota bacterium]